MHTGNLFANVQQDLEILFTATSEAILLIEANGIILAANEMSAKWLNHSADMLIGENLFQLHTPFKAPVKDWVHAAISNNSIHDSDTKMGERFIRVRLIPIADGAEVTRLIIIGQDITEQKQAEAQVREFTGQLEQKVRERTKKLEALNQKLAEDKRQAELLVNLSRHLMEDSQDFRQLLEHTTNQISELIGDTCLIALFTSDLTVMEVQAITNRDVESRLRQRKQLLNRTISVETNVITSYILRGERFSAIEITPELGKGLLPPEFAAQLGKDGIQALEVFPLQVGEQPLGMLAIAREKGDPYNESEIAFIRSLISPIALAIKNAKLVKQLTNSQNQLRGLSQQLVQIQEDQFSHLAAELHDRVGQDMTAININLSILRNLLPQPISEDVTSRLADTEKLVRESVKHMRSTIAEFRPAMLDQYGLTAALYWYSEQYHRRTQIKAVINDQYMKNARLPAEVEIALFRIAQEAMNNVAKHAKAKQVEIELFEDEGHIMMAVTDDGIGFDMQEQASRSPDHWGVTLMQERARAVNGEFLIRSVPGQGTQVVVQVRNTA